MNTHPTNKLDLSSLEILSVSDWAELIKSVVREDLVHGYLVNKTSIPSAVEELPEHYVSVQLPINHRVANEDGEVIAIGLFLKNKRGSTRDHMREGFVKAITDLAQGESLGWEIVLERVVSLAIVVEGMLTRTALDKVLAREDLPLDLRGFIVSERKQTRRS